MLNNILLKQNANGLLNSYHDNIGKNVLITEAKILHHLSSKIDSEIHVKVFPEESEPWLTIIYSKKDKAILLIRHPLKYYH